MWKLFQLDLFFSDFGVSIEMETQPVGVFYCPTLYEDALQLSGLFWLHKLGNIVVLEVLAAKLKKSEIQSIAI